MSERPRSRFQARVLDKETYLRVAPQIDISWSKSNLMYQQSGFIPKSDVPDSGKLLVQSPYTAQFDVTWGITPTVDQAKYRWLYRARTEVRRAIDVKTTFALGRGFKIVVKDNPEIEEYCNRLMSQLGMKEKSIMMMNNALVYGQSYAEKIRAGADDLMEGEALETQPISLNASAFNVDKNLEGLASWSAAQFDNEKPSASAPYTTKMSNWLNQASEQYRAMRKSMDDYLASHEKQYGYDDAYSPEFMSCKANFVFEETGAIRSTQIDVPMQATARPTFTFEGAAKHLNDKKKGTDALGGPNGLVFTYAKRDEPNDWNTSGELIGLKVVDPLYMQVQRHPLDIIVGFIQWTVNAVPQTMMPEEMVYIKWMPNTWIYESAYGASALMPITHHISMLIQAEEDLKIWHHMYAKPFRVLYVGERGKPYLLGSAKISNYTNIMGAIQPNQDLVLPGETELEFPLTNFAPNQTSEFWITLLRDRIYEGLGIPSILVNDVNSSNRATSDIALQAFIQEEIMIQQLFGEQLLQQIVIPEVIRKFKGKFGKKQASGKPKKSDSKDSKEGKDDSNKLPEITIVFPAILEEDRNKKADRIDKAVQVPYLTINEARREMSIPPITPEDDNYDESYDKISESPQAQGGMFGSVAGKSMTQPSKMPEKSESQKTGPREESKQKRAKDNPSAD